MNVYLDASIVVRKLQREQGSLVRWGNWARAFSSELLRVEVLRTIDRSRIRGALTDSNVADLLERARAVFDGVEFVALTSPVLERASQPFPTTLGTLDALHLATALRVTEAGATELTFLTHDVQLALAARSLNLAVDGA